MKLLMLLAASVALPLPVIAQTVDDPLAPLGADEPLVPVNPVQPTTSSTVSKPKVETPGPAPEPPKPAVPVVVPRDWNGVFTEIAKGDWEGARLGIAALPESPLRPLAKAQLYTAKGSPRVELSQIEALIEEAPELPQAEQLARMANARGAVDPLPYYRQQRILNLGAAPRRSATRRVAGDPVADQLRLTLDPFVKVDDGIGAEYAVLAVAEILTPAAKIEAAHRVAWIYYVAGRDADVRRIADTGRAGVGGEWAAQLAWVAGLASWRQNDFAAAYTNFRDASLIGGDLEFNAAAHYWAARAAQASGRPREVAGLLRVAARSNESFYGLMARELLGMPAGLAKPSAPSNTDRVLALPNVRRAQELAAMGRRGEAEALLRHQARIGRPDEHRALIRAADRLNLPGAQFWLAHFGPSGVSVDAADRYPTPNWTPRGGWRVDPALAYAHVIQESNFRSDAVSPAGAVGLMQVRPGTAGDTSRDRGGGAVSQAALKDPATNLDYGQAFIELIRAKPATQGQLPKVIAAYNAGPLPVARWTYYDRGDPLLWIESIPYWETRYYVPSVLRNMWVIQAIEGKDSPTKASLIQHKWPAFPARR
jgi:soluble lytic murein transglycosylase